MPMLFLVLGSSQEREYKFNEDAFYLLSGWIGSKKDASLAKKWAAKARTHKQHN